ncbi:MAG: trypsin-like peptidase domain-containing protein [Bacilli bacterium]|nr:trypsin-like peptidase domain-containing protein [Bacilli bacterium]
MKNKKIVIIGIVIGIILFAFNTFVLPIIQENNSKSRVYYNMKKDEDIIKKSIIGIMPETEMDGLKSRGGFGSGVIFDKVDNIYYAITAKHVIDDPNSSYKLFTINTEFNFEIISLENNINIEIPKEEYYESLIEAKIEYISDSTDLAIVSFVSDEDLPVLEIEENDFFKGEKIMCIGHPEGHRYYVSFGIITSDIKNITYTKSNNNEKAISVVEHNAYLNQGNSGGVAINENMKIIGINVGGAFTITGRFSKGYMIPNKIVKENINNWKLNNS